MLALTQSGTLARWITAVCLGLNAISCAGSTRDGDEDPYRKNAYPNRPPHFMDSCVGDAGTCESPWVCLPAATGIGMDRSICSKACKNSSDCPRWTEPGGHCRGDVQSQCLDGVCQAWCL